MGTYKGNKGHLMQHWTLCEVLSIAWRQGVRQLNYIDAHAMAPLATETDWNKHDRHFTAVKAHLASGTSTYEVAWRFLTRNVRHAYPSSASFVQHVWLGQLALYLCEIDCHTCDEIQEWLDDVQHLPSFASAPLHCGDWRDAFSSGDFLSSIAAATPQTLTLVSFDPYVISRAPRQAPKGSGNIHESDLELIGENLASVQGRVFVQLSTYNNGRMEQESIKTLVDSFLEPHCLTHVATTQTGGDMMSLIYGRYKEWVDEFEKLGHRFTDWFEKTRGYPPTPLPPPMP